MEFCPHCMRPASGNYCINCGKPLAWKPGINQLPAGTVLDGSGLHRYLTGAAIGQGGFGITYIAAEAESGRRVAIKECFPVQCAMRGANGVLVEPRPGKADTLRGALDSFLDEARLLAKQNKLKSVVQVVDFFSTNGTAYLVMEYLDGETLQQKMQREGRLPAQKFIAMLKPLMADIGALHESGIIHRDISPDNIMWMPNDTLKLLDFGCARSVEDGKSMSILLKHGFAPVEQYQTRGQGPWTDIYSLCAAIYYCLTGKLPQAAVERLEEDGLVPPRNYCPELTESQQAALLWGLEVQPAKRPKEIGMLMAQLYKSERPRQANKKRIIAIAAAGAVVFAAVLAIALGGSEKGSNYLPEAENTAPVVTLPASSITAQPSTSADAQELTSGGFRYVASGGEAVLTGCEDGSAAQLELPDELDGLPVTAIADAAFAGMDGLLGVSLPKGLESIGAGAFEDCAQLRVVSAYGPAETGSGAFDGCTKLRTVFDMSGSGLAATDIGLAESVDVLAKGMDTGMGALKTLICGEQGELYGETDEGVYVVMKLPTGTDSIEIADSVDGKDVAWLYEGAIEGVPRDTKVYIGKRMAFPFDLIDKLTWDLHVGNGIDGIGFSWLVSCYATQRINELRDSTLDFYDLEHAGADYKLSRATLQRANELSLLFDHDRPYAGSWDTILDEFDVDRRGGAEYIYELDSSEGIEGAIDYVFSVIVPDAAKVDEDSGELYNDFAAGLFWSGRETDSIYICCIAVYT